MQSGDYQVCVTGIRNCISALVRSLAIAVHRFIAVSHVGTVIPCCATLWPKLQYCLDGTPDLEKYSLHPSGWQSYLCICPKIFTSNASDPTSLPAHPLVQWFGVHLRRALASIVHSGAALCASAGFSAV